MTRLDYVDVRIWKKERRLARSLIGAPTADCQQDQIERFTFNRKRPAPAMPGPTMLPFSRDVAEAGKTSSSHTLMVVDTAGEKGDAGQHEQGAHGLLDAMQMSA